MTVIWGANYSVIKAALREIPPVGFNALRLILASTIFLIAIGVGSRRTPDTLRDWMGIVALAVGGQFLYQLLFMSALSRTSVANSSLIIGCTPIFVALLTAALGHERVTALRWAGALLSAFGIYLVIGHGASVSRVSLGGDLTMVAAVMCWSAATVGSRPLLARHSPLIVTGYSMAIGSALYAPLAWSDLRGLAWRGVSTGAWLALGFSAVFALYVAYMIWFTAVQRLGNTRTSVYSNMVPIAAMLVARFWLGEDIGMLKIAGAAAIILGVALTKVQLQGQPVSEPA
jgi:drug/metabolite transporter (DMT)-like permease